MTEKRLPATLHSTDAFLRHPSAGFDGAFHWEWVITSVNAKIKTRKNKITPTDIDGVVEINNFFLAFETKDVGIEIDSNSGQERSLKKLLRTGLFTVIHLWGKDRPVSWYYERWPNFKSDLIKIEAEHSIEETSIFKFVIKWATAVDKLDQEYWRVRLIEAAKGDTLMARKAIERGLQFEFISGQWP